MTRDDFIGQLESYLDEFEGMTPLPDAVRNAVRADLPTTRQMKRRATAWNQALRLIAGAAAVVLVAFIGYQLFGSSNTGGPQPSLTPSASPGQPLVDLGTNPAHRLLAGQVVAAVLDEVDRQNEIARQAGDDVEPVPAYVLSITLLESGERFSWHGDTYTYEFTVWAAEWRGLVRDCLGSLCHSYSGGVFFIQDSDGEVAGAGYLPNQP
jgi:hypothetical protein